MPSNSLGDFQDIEAAVPAVSQKKKPEEQKKKKQKFKKKGTPGDCDDPTDDSSEDSSDDDQDTLEASCGDDFAKYCGLSLKFRRIIRHQGGA